MAKKTTNKEKPKYHCRECKHSYDWHEKAHDTGLPFMCHCPHYTNGKFCKFLDDYQCAKFELKDERTM